MTVTPETYALEAARFAAFPNVVVGAGLHPWWAAGASRDGRLEQLLSIVADARLVGEVGLDFAPRHAVSADEQLLAFREVVRACAREGGKVLSVHAVRAAGEVLDVLEEAGALSSCACVLHWFSGTSEELSRAVRAGCWFSVGERMAATKRGRAYLRAIPADRLLLETDAPPTPAASAQPGESAASGPASTLAGAPRARDRASAQTGAPRASETPGVPRDVPYAYANLERSLLSALDVLCAEKGEEAAALVEKTSENVLFPEGIFW